MADSITVAQPQEDTGIKDVDQERLKDTPANDEENTTTESQNGTDEAKSESKAGDESGMTKEAKETEEEKGETETKNEASGQNVKTDKQNDESDKGTETEGEASPQKSGTPKAQRTPPSDRKTVKKEEISDEQRKAKIEELRKKKIIDYKKKEDEKRKAVLERKKKLEEAEKAKQEALLKKISTGTGSAPKRPASAPARRAVSFSSLAHLKKTHAVAQEIDIGESKPAKSKEAEDKVPKAPIDADRRKTLPARPRSAMERKRPNSFSSDKAKPNVQRYGAEVTSGPGSRPRSSMGARSEPKIRQSLTGLPHRPPSASSNRPGVKPAEEKKPPVSKSRQMPSLPGKPLVPPSKEREMKKAKSASSVLHHGAQEKSKGPIQPDRKSLVGAEKPKAKTEATKPSPGKPRPATTDRQRPPTSKPKEPGKPERRRSHEGSPSTKQDGSKKPLATNEADAKRLLAEKRRQVKEEAERKALVEQNRLEEERIRKEEEQKRRAEELRREEERQKAHLEELQKEAEERERQAQEEKERKEMEEKERLEAERRQRQEDIERKAQEEVDRRAKEREQKRHQEEADRLVRKKRVQEILGSRIRGSPVSERPVSPTPFATGSPEETPGENSPPAIDSAASARDRVQKLLEKNQRKSEESDNGQDDYDKKEIVKPQLSPVKPNEEILIENSRDVAPETTEQTISNENTFEQESSLTEADRALEDIERKRSETTEDSSNYSLINGTENKLDEIPAVAHNEETRSTSIEEKKLWNEAEKVMAENQENLLNSLDKNNSSKAEQQQSSEESRLWHLVEGQLELEECF